MSKDKVTLYVSSCRRYLTKRFGGVQPEWEITLNCLENTLRRYEQVQEAIRINGVFDPVTGRKSPLLGTEKDLLATLMKITQKIGVTPYDAAKIKVIEEDDSGVLANLMGIDD